jgi:hypothetical protein
MRGIEFLPEGLDADTPIGVEEALAVLAQVKISIDQGLDGTRHLGLAKRRAQDLAK